jgi:hypothetical protein
MDYSINELEKIERKRFIRQHECHDCYWAKQEGSTLVNRFIDWCKFYGNKYCPKTCLYAHERELKEKTRTSKQQSS